MTTARSRQRMAYAMVILSGIACLATEDLSYTEVLTLDLRREVPPSGGEETIRFGTSEGVSRIQVAVDPPVGVEGIFYSTTLDYVTFQPDGGIPSVRFKPRSSCQRVTVTYQQDAEGVVHGYGNGGTFANCFDRCKDFSLVLRQEQGDHSLSVNIKIEISIEVQGVGNDVAELWVKE